MQNKLYLENLLKEAILNFSPNLIFLIIKFNCILHNLFLKSSFYTFSYLLAVLGICNRLEVVSYL